MDLAERLEMLRSGLHGRVTILAWDANGLVAVEKVPGLRSHPNVPGTVDRNALLAAPYDGKRRAILDRPIFLLHRLDSATGGVLLLALDEAVAMAVRDAFGRQRVAKDYHAFVVWRRNFSREHLTDSLCEMRRDGLLRVRGGCIEVAKAEAIFQSERRLGPLHLALLELHPSTGRTNQLRVQCARRGMPILGDRTYGDFSANRSAEKFLEIRGLQLHASAIRLRYELQKRSFSFGVTSPNAGTFRDWTRFPLPSRTGGQDL